MRFGPSIDLGDAKREALDPGIRGTVESLWAVGVLTTWSCEGGTGHLCPTPEVSFEATDKDFALSVFKAVVDDPQMRPGLPPPFELRCSWYTRADPHSFLGPHWQLRWKGE